MTSEDHDVVCPRCGVKVRLSHLPIHLKIHDEADAIKRGEKTLEEFKKKQEGGSNEQAYIPTYRF